MAAGSKIGIKLIGIVIGIPVSIATRKVVEKTWAAARPDAPPRSPSDRDVRWVDAIAWATLSAAGVVVADLLSKRGAEAAFKAITGNEPPPPKPAKSEKKAQQSREKAGVVED
jgi:hypothetical protein